jgi:Domain of unknown function (DUF3291)
LAGSKAALDDPLMAGFVKRLAEIPCCGGSPLPILSTVDEAKNRLAHLEKHGPTPVAFHFTKIFKGNDAF